jgi:hypothetical protein
MRALKRIGRKLPSQSALRDWLGLSPLLVAGERRGEEDLVFTLETKGILVLAWNVMHGVVGNLRLWVLHPLLCNHLVYFEYYYYCYYYYY